MTFEELWDVIVKKNPNLQADTMVTMTVNGFKKALKMAYEQGVKQGVENGELDEIDQNVPPLKTDDEAVEKLMNMFGMKK